MSAGLLRLSHLAGAGSATVHIELEEPGQARQAVTVPFSYQVSDDNRERLRWYYEDYLEFPAEPAPQIAASIETRIDEVGRALFKNIFETDPDARDIWVRVRDRIDETRVEVNTQVDSAAAVPWELMRDPKTGQPVAISAAAFVRGYANPAKKPKIPGAEARPVRILLVICRPGGADDVPFRSVASRLLKGLHGRTTAAFELDVLRPPTYARLAEVLREAAETHPYAIVHFDGHGELRPGARGQPQGHVLFEPTAAGSKDDPIDGSRLGALLAETGVRILVLNACRSEYAEPPQAPQADRHGDSHSRVRAFGSLALQVMDAGVPGVVAMQYNVYVVTAAHFVADLYATLARGQTLGRAASFGRKQLHSHPERDVLGISRTLQDWAVPVVYEAAALALFPEARDDPFATLDLADTAAAPSVAAIDPTLPSAPDLGFFGRDETLLALDRSFDTQRIVLLHAYAGSGKTATAAEFARWYALTGGISGPVLFTSFEYHTPVAGLLETFHRSFGGVLAARNIHWLALSEKERRRLALQVLGQIPVLWIWDNVEAITGFGTGTSTWLEEERVDLRDFLRELRDVGARVLLTSRSLESEWLGDLPARVAVPPMPMHERLQLAQALALRQGSSLEPIAAWRPLLRFTAGNPLTITAVVGAALRKGLRTSGEILSLVERLSQGEAELTDDAEGGRSRSLRASLSYGFAEVFSEHDRRRIALLHLFRGVVWAPMLVAMGFGEDSEPEMRSISEAEVEEVLSRAADIGQLTSLGGGLYAIHPVLPAYLKELFAHHYPGEAASRATKAFCTSLSAFGASVARAYEADSSAVVMLAATEANLLQALSLARLSRWHKLVSSTMVTLATLYGHQGRWSELSYLTEEILPNLVDYNPDGPLPGREDEWNNITQIRVRLAFERLDIAEAARLQQLVVADAERGAAEALQRSSEALTDEDRRKLGYLSVALMELGNAYVEREDPRAVETLERSLEIARRVEGEEALVSYNLAIAHLVIPEKRDVDMAERLLNRALELEPETSRLRRSRIYAELGFVGLQRLQRATQAGDSNAATGAAISAISAYGHALDLTPSDAHKSLATKHLNLGTVYMLIGQPQGAQPHLQEAVRYAELCGDTWAAGNARVRLAQMLQESGRVSDAVLYANRALIDLRPLGSQASDLIELATSITKGS